jgi:hypothetical protein
VDPRAVLDAVVKRKIPSPRRESNPRTPIVQPVAQRYLSNVDLTTLAGDAEDASRFHAKVILDGPKGKLTTFLDRRSTVFMPRSHPGHWHSRPVSMAVFSNAIHFTLKMDAAWISETLIHSRNTTRQNNIHKSPSFDYILSQFNPVHFISQRYIRGYI